jgi:hypothetical protein
MAGRKPTCCRCGKLKERISRAYCRVCTRQYEKQWRKRHPLTDEQRWKNNVRSLARSYWVRGKLRQKPCRHCGESRTERHHPDYTRPLYVFWLCRPCHLKLHANRRRRARRRAEQVRKAARRR